MLVNIRINLVKEYIEKEFTSLIVLCNIPPQNLQKIVKMDPESQKSVTYYYDLVNKEYTSFPRQNSFEVYYKNQCLHSKLQTNQFPDPQFVAKQIKAKKKLLSPAKSKSPYRLRQYKLSPQSFRTKLSSNLNRTIEIHQTLNFNGVNNSQNIIQDNDLTQSTFIPQQLIPNLQDQPVNINIIKVNNNLVFTNKKLSPKTIKMYNTSPYRNGERISKVFQFG